MDAAVGAPGPAHMDDVEGASASDIQHMSKTFFERIERGNNLTKIGSSSNPRDTARVCLLYTSPSPRDS